MWIPLRSLPIVAALLGVASVVSAQTAQTFTPKSIVQFQQGGDKERAALQRVPAFAELVKGQFGLGAADFDGDGVNEIVLLSLSCDAGGCPVVVMQNKGGSAAAIFARKMNGRLAITQEKVNGYYAIAAADPSGAIMTDPRTGKQIVYPLGAAAPANAAPTPTPTPTPAARPAPTASSPVGPTAAASPNGEFLPLCLLPKCLNPRVVSKSGIGTANARAEARVTAEDATPWCAKNMPLYKGCVEDQVAYGGAADRFNNIEFKATANCVTGQLVAIDELKYTYVGTWPAGGPGAGRPRFKGPYTTDGTTQFEQLGAIQVASGAYSISEVANKPNAGESLAVQWEVLCAGAPAPAH